MNEANEQNNEARLRKALQRMLDFHFNDTPWEARLAAAKYAEKLLKETAPEPPKHPAVVGWEKHFGGNSVGSDYRVWAVKCDYMQGFKDALLWAAEQSEANEFVSPAYFRDTADTVPLL